MAQTIKIHESVEITYHDEHKLYLVVAYDPVSEMDVYMLNINDDLELARATIAFEGYEQIRFTSMEQHFKRLDNGEDDLMVQ